MAAPNQNSSVDDNDGINNNFQPDDSYPQLNEDPLKSDIPRCRKGFLTAVEIQNYMTTLLQAVRNHDKIRDRIDKESLVEILHRGVEVFWNEPMLIEIPFPDQEVVVIGDLHGHLLSLLTVILSYGLPSKRNYVFLGDYVDRGPFQVETFLFVLLMKLRWPGRVYMLRGNHEAFEMNTVNQFFTVCREEFFDENVYQVFSRVFDVMPVAAIFGDYFLFVHGGVSQWMTSRENIRNIQRPTYLSQMKMLDCCILADILWADPDLKQEKAFAPSNRYVSYKFNMEGLNGALKALNVKVLVRGHQPSPSGYIENVPGKCYTVHTAPVHSAADRKVCGAIFICSKGPARKHIAARPVTTSSQHSLIDESISNVESLLQEEFETAAENQSTMKNHCEYCAIRETKSLLESPRILSHLEIAEWVHEYAQQLVLDDGVYKRLSKNLDAVNRRFVRYFPVYYDILYLNGRTFRIGLSEEENKLIKIYSEHEDADTSVQFLIASTTTPLGIKPRNVGISGRDNQQGEADRQQENGSENVPEDTMIISDKNEKQSFFKKIRKLFNCVNTITDSPQHSKEHEVYDVNDNTSSNSPSVFDTTNE